MSNRPLSLRPHYFDKPFSEPKTLISEAREALTEVDFDTIVCTGISGVVAGSLLAHEFGCELLVVRKPDDTSTHSSRRVEGYLGARWLFVDDFCDSGGTLRRVKDAVERVVKVDSWGVPRDEPHPTTYVGAYLYNRALRFRAPGDEVKRDYEFEEAGQ